MLLSNHLRGLRDSFRHFGRRLRIPRPDGAARWHDRDKGSPHHIHVGHRRSPQERPYRLRMIDWRIRIEAAELPLKLMPKGQETRGGLVLRERPYLLIPFIV